MLSDLLPISFFLSTCLEAAAPQPAASVAVPWFDSQFAVFPLLLRQTLPKVLPTSLARFVAWPWPDADLPLPTTC